jgi:hypothetical protein
MQAPRFSVLLERVGATQKATFKAVGKTDGINRVAWHLPDSVLIGSKMV